MPEPVPSPSVFQLRVVLGGISPLIWRRLVVDASSTLDELHHVLRVAFAWSGDHLHRFKVHGREYDAGAPVALGGLGLRPSERFIYDYDFAALWRHDIRVEQITAAEGARALPRCTGGRRATPPEDSGGPWAFMEQTQPHRLFAVARRVAEILSEIIEDPAAVEEYRFSQRCPRHLSDAADACSPDGWRVEPRCSGIQGSLKVAGAGTSSLPAHGQGAGHPALASRSSNSSSCLTGTPSRSTSGMEGLARRDRATPFR